MRIVDCCNNLNSGDGRSPATERLTEDISSVMTIMTASTAVLPANANRRIVKIYVVSLSVPSAEIWIRYGAAATLLNSAHSLPLRHLLIIDSPQAANAISAICSAGTAQVRVSVAERII
jgi:hypothetical protein